MKVLTPSRVAGGVVLAAGASVLVFACSTPMSGEINVQGAGLSAHGSVSTNGGSVNLGGGLPPGKCLKVEFRGADGGLLGTTTAHVPGSMQVPAGTTNASEHVVDCPDNLVPAPSGSGGVRSQHPYEFAPWIDVMGSPIMPDLVDGGIYKNAVYHFRVQVNPGVDPFSRIEPILLGGPGTPVPPDVQVVSFTQLIPEASGARMVVGATAAFDQFALDWNGQSGYANLATGTNVVEFDAGNDWHVIESVIAVQDFNALPGQPNSGTTVRKTVADVGAETESASFTALSY